MLLLSTETLFFCFAQVQKYFIYTLVSHLASASVPEPLVSYVISADTKATFGDLKLYQLPACRKLLHALAVNVLFPGTITANSL